MKELAGGLDSPFKIASIRKLNKKNPDTSSPNTAKYISSKTITLAFKGQNLSNYVFVYHVRYEVSPFVAKVTFCSSWTFCSSFVLDIRNFNVKVPFQCKISPDAPTVLIDYMRMACFALTLIFPPTCANCKSPHASSNPACPELLVHRHVHKLAASKNILFAEANKIIRNSKIPLIILYLISPIFRN